MDSAFFSKFDASRHPDLRLGKYTQEFFLKEFKETFNDHH